MIPKKRKRAATAGVLASLFVGLALTPSVSFGEITEAKSITSATTLSTASTTQGTMDGDDTLTVSSGGSITTASGAVYVSGGSTNTITNAGTIASSDFTGGGSGDAISASLTTSSSMSVTNSGTISGHIRIVNAGNTATITNTGVITGDIIGGAGGITISSSGTITGTIAGGAAIDTLTISGGVVAGPSTNTATNTIIDLGGDDDHFTLSGGTVTGSATLGAGTDSATLTGGTMAGTLDLGTGNDNLTWSGGTITGTINGNTGVDTVSITTDVALVNSVFGVESATIGSNTSGTGSTFTISASTAWVNGGDLTVLSGSSLVWVGDNVNYSGGVEGAAGYIHTETLSIDGTLWVRGSTMTLDGNLNMNNGSTLKVDLGAYTGASGVETGSVVITQRENTGYTFNINGAITVTPNYVGYIANAASITLVDVGGTPGGTTWREASITYTNTSAVLTGSVMREGNDLRVYFTRTSLTSLATSPAGAAVAAFFESLGASATGELATLQGAFSNLTSAAQVDQAAKMLTPNLEGATTGGAMSASNQAMNTVGNRMADIRRNRDAAGYVAGGPFMKPQAWGQIFYGSYDQDKRKSDVGYDADTFGVALGGDFDLTRRVRLGGALSYAVTNVDSKLGAGNTVDIDTLQFTIYGGYDNGKSKWYMDWQAGMAKNEYEVKRRINFGGVDWKPTGSYDGSQLVFRFGGGYRWMWNKNMRRVYESKRGTGWLEVTPNAYLQYTHLSTDAYSETGSGALSVSEADVDQLQSHIGVRAGWGMFEARLTWVFNLVNEAMENSSAFVSGIATGGAAAAQFKTSPEDPARSSVLVGLGFNKDFAKNFNFNFDYNLQIKDKFLGHTGVAQVRYSF